MSNDGLGSGLRWEHSHLSSVSVNPHWLEEQRCELELNLMNHFILLFSVMLCLRWRVIDFLKCAFGVTGEAIQSVYNVSGGDKAIHRSAAAQGSPHQENNTSQTHQTAAHRSAASCRLPDEITVE